MDKQFKNPNGGRRYLRALFFEESDNLSSVMYTLKREDHLGYPSLFRLYMETGDITEYKFANLHLDGWPHWAELAGQDWFQPYVTAWRYELELKLRSQALETILKVANEPSHISSYQANKYILEANWKPAGASKRGRPTKDEVKAEITAQAASLSQINEDAERIGLKVN
jgi:hypothetical protein